MTNIAVDEQLSMNQVWFLPSNGQITFINATGNHTIAFVGNPATCGYIDGITAQELVDPDLVMDVGL